MYSAYSVYCIYIYIYVIKPDGRREGRGEGEGGQTVREYWDCVCIAIGPFSQLNSSGGAGGTNNLPFSMNWVYTTGGSQALGLRSSLGGWNGVFLYLCYAGDMKTPRHVTAQGGVKTQNPCLCRRQVVELDTHTHENTHNCLHRHTLHNVK